MFSFLAERLRFRNNLGNQFTKRMWTGKAYNNVCPGDENLPIWHLPSEKKFGLHELYLLFMRDKTIRDEKDFRRKAGKYCGVPRTCLQKKAKDMLSVLKTKIKP